MTTVPSRPRAALAEDAELFAGPALDRLRTAAAEAAWLLDRGYPRERALDLVGDRHSLQARQRTALQRGLCTAERADDRQARRWPEERVRGSPLWVDGFNLLITLEVALGGGVVIRGRDGVLRDLAGLRGGYQPVDETDPALGLVDRALAVLQPAHVTWLLDAPVPHSGRLGHLLRARPWPCPVTAEIVPDPDRVLARCDGVVSSDSDVLDRCGGWLNLAETLIHAHVRQARVVPLFDELSLHLGCLP